MLTWGFEGEAQRLAERQQRRFKRRKLYGAGFAEDMSARGGCLAISPLLGPQLILVFKGRVFSTSVVFRVLLERFSSV